MEVIDVLHQIGYTDLWDTGKHYRTKPLYRDSGNRTSLSITKNTGDWYDFSARVGGNLNQLIQITTKTMTDDEIKTQFGDLNLGNGEHRVELTHVKKFDKQLLPKLHRDHNYWINRGIAKYTIEQFGGGTTDNGRMKNRYVFPIFDEKDDLVGFSGRSLTDSDIRWKHLGKKNNWIYPLKWNSQDIIKKKKVILVESIGDMLSLFEVGIQNVIVLFGVQISGSIIQFLLKIDIQSIILLLNNDEQKHSVGNDASIEIKNKLSNFFDDQQIKIITLPQKDINVMLQSNKQGLIDFCTQMELYGK